MIWTRTNERLYNLLHIWRLGVLDWAGTFKEYHKIVAVTESGISHRMNQDISLEPWQAFDVLNRDGIAW